MTLRDSWRHCTVVGEVRRSEHAALLYLARQTKTAAQHARVAVEQAEVSNVVAAHRSIAPLGFEARSADGRESEAGVLSFAAQLQRRVGSPRPRR
ncbi:hypothetical protein [Streptomyces puniciscabiei]|uniref:hypothetical protein n=1 Tax=Streptomyces puniciscabiei TaxID=164348 RepID=UPI0006EB86EF|nr:hypothetical protein [Streptomyces puniciscabiei]